MSAFISRLLQLRAARPTPLTEESFDKAGLPKSECRPRGLTSESPWTDQPRGRLVDHLISAYETSMVISGRGLDFSVIRSPGDQI